MGRYAIRGLILFAVAFAALCPQTARGQVNPCTSGRLPSPFPTFAEELRQLNAGQPVLGFVVGDLQLVGEVHDRVAIRARILRSLQKCFFENESDLFTFSSDVAVKGYFQDNGYFEARVDVEVKLLDIKNKLQRILIIARVHEGDQFRVGKFTVIPSDPDEKSLLFSANDYKQWLHLHEGSVISAERIRDWVEEVTRKYGRIGHMDATAEPNFDIDHKSHTVSILMKITEGPEYYIAGVEVRGLSPEGEADFRKRVISGDLYRQDLVEAAIQRNNPAPKACRVFPLVERVSRDRQKSTANFIFDFKDCHARTN